MTIDEIHSHASTKLLQYKIPIGIGLIALMFVLRACDSTSEQSSEVAQTKEQVLLSKKERQVDSVQRSTPETVNTTHISQSKQEAPKQAPAQKEIPTWLPASEGVLPGRITLELDSVEFTPIEGVDNHPERIYTNPDCVVALSKTPFCIEQVYECVEGEYIPAAVLIKEQAESNAMLEKNIPDTTLYTDILPLDAVTIE